MRRVIEVQIGEGINRERISKQVAGTDGAGADGFKRSVVSLVACREEEPTVERWPCCGWFLRLRHPFSCEWVTGPTLLLALLGSKTGCFEELPAVVTAGTTPTAWCRRESPGSRAPGLQGASARPNAHLHRTSPRTARASPLSQSPSSACFVLFLLSLLHIVRHAPRPLTKTLPAQNRSFGAYQNIGACISISAD